MILFSRDKKSLAEIFKISLSVTLANQTTWFSLKESRRYKKLFQSAGIKESFAYQSFELKVLHILAAGLNVLLKSYVELVACGHYTKKREKVGTGLTTRCPKDAARRQFRRTLNPIKFRTLILVRIFSVLITGFKYLL